MRSDTHNLFIPVPYPNFISMGTERLNLLSTNGLSWVRNDWHPPVVVGEFLWVVGELALHGMSASWPKLSARA